MEETGILEKANLSGPCYPALNQVIRAGKGSQFPAGGNGLWRASPTAGVVVRKELKVYFNLPDACPVAEKRVLSKLVRALVC
jgi:hypothetical protein